MTILQRQLLQFALMGLFIVISIGTVVQAQEPVSNACQTYYGTCFVQLSAPLGTPCYCGNDPGSIVYPQQNNFQGGSRNTRLSDACATRYGVCRVRLAPIGSSCFCGPDPGRIIGR